MKQQLPKRIPLRFTVEEYRALNDKRHNLDTTFQEIGHRLFLEWLASGGSKVKAEVRSAGDEDSQPRPDNRLTDAGPTAKRIQKLLGKKTVDKVHRVVFSEHNYLWDLRGLIPALFE